MAQLNINALAEMMSQTANKSIGGVSRGVKQQNAVTQGQETQNATAAFELEQKQKESEMKAQQDKVNAAKRAALSPYLRVQPFMDGTLADANGDGVVSDAELASVATKVLGADLNRPGMTAEEKMATEKLLQTIKSGSETGDYSAFMQKVGLAQKGIDELATAMPELQTYTTAAMRDAAEQRRKNRQTGVSERAVAVQEEQLNRPGPSFTLGENQQRYDASGNLIASGPEKQADPQFNVGGPQPSQPSAPQGVLPAGLEGEDVIDLSTGVQSSVTGALEGFSPTSEGVRGEKNVQAKQVMGGIAKQLESLYVNNPRVPVSEREQMQALGLTDVQGGMWQSASSIREKFNAAVPLMERRLAEELRLANDPAATTKVKGEAQLISQQLYSALTSIKAVLSSGQQQGDDDINSLLDKYAPQGQ